MKNMKSLKNLLFLPILISGTINSAEVTLDRIAIIVGDGVVLESQIDKMLNIFKQRAIQQNQEDQLPPDDILIEQVKERLIIEELQLQSGRRAGIRIGDAELNEYVANVASQNNLSVDAFINNIEAQGESYLEFREQLKKELIIQRVQRGKVGSQIVITDQELERFLATEEAKANLLPELQLNQILVKELEIANSLKEKLNSGQDFQELAKKYSIASNASSGGSLGWRKSNDLPDLFFNAVNKKPKGFISKPLKSGAGYHLIQLGDKRGPFVDYQDQWKVRHILMSPTKLRDETFTKQELQDVRARLLDGEEFALLAKEFSEDPGSANKGGDLDWLPMGATAPEFEAMMLQTPIGSVSEVFESQFGFHFLEVIDKRNYDRTSDIVEDRAYGVLFSRKFDEELENSLRTMRAEAFVEVKELD